MLFSIFVGLAHATTVPPAAARAAATLAKLSPKETLKLLHGTGWVPWSGYVGATAGVKDAGIPPLLLNDGPQGFRAGPLHRGTSTQFPSGLAIASTWDADAARRWGEAMGTEFVGKGASVQLGPGLCLLRVPTNGRAFEYLSGEEPLLGAVLGAATVQAIQSKGVMATAKHWILNSQEDHRTSISDDADERTRFELYYPPFQAAVDAGVASVMCSYNRLNGSYACENDATLRTDLRARLNFTGFVVSDWGATHDSSKAANSTLDMEMPGSDHFHLLLKDIEEGKVSRATFDAMALRVLTKMYAFGMFDPGYAPSNGSLKHNVTCAAHQKVARTLATEGTVLLKHAPGMLPLQPSPSMQLAIIGKQAKAKVISAGGGSGGVVASRVLAPLDALETALAPHNATLTYVPSDAAKAAAAASTADYALVFVSTSSAEGSDRKTLALGDGQDELVNAVAAVNRRTIVCVVSPGPVLMPWATHANVSAVVLQIMPGQEIGGALTDVLLGAAIPAGRLPFSLPTVDNELNFTQQQYPGVEGHSTYTERLLVGYRWYDAHRKAPAFPFGHGLSPGADFAYANLSIVADAPSPTDASTHAAGADVALTFAVTNKGARAGVTVVQAYVAYPAAYGEPPRQLRAFSKLTLAPGSTQHVRLALPPRAFSVWDAAVHAWVRAKGTFDLFVGESSRDLRLRGKVSLP